MTLTNLHSAVSQGKLDRVSQLIASGININEQDLFGDTALHCAVLSNMHSAYAAFSHKQSAMVAALITAGANTNIQNKKKETPLHVAACSGQPEIITALVAAGSDLTLVDYHGYTAQAIAIQRGYTAVVGILTPVHPVIKFLSTNRTSWLAGALLGGLAFWMMSSWLALATALAVMVGVVIADNYLKQRQPHAGLTVANIPSVNTMINRVTLLFSHTPKNNDAQPQNMRTDLTAIPTYKQHSP